MLSRLRGRGVRTRKVDPSELFRRYFVNTLFDSTFVCLCVLSAQAFRPEPDADLALSSLFAACLAIGISTGVSVYEAEHAEVAIRLRHLERHMLSSMKDTEIARRLHVTRYATTLVNLAAPLLVFAVIGAPIGAYRLGLVTDFGAAAVASGALGIAIIFATGYYLGGLTGGRPWAKAARMAVVACLTFVLLVLLGRVL